MKALALMGVLLLSGCSLTVPSFYDGNESKGIIDVWVAVKRIDCGSHFVTNQVGNVGDKLEWLDTYSKAKKSEDVKGTIELLGTTLSGIQKKSVISPAYCRLKRDQLLKQTEAIAVAIMGRY